MSVEHYLISGAGVAAIGALAGFALKRVIHFAAIIMGLFFLGIMYLSYKGWIRPDWALIQSQTQSGLENATHQATQMIQSTAAQMSQHPAMIHAQGMSISAGVGFIPGFIFGLKH